MDLTQLTYNEAVSVLKAQTAQAQVVLRVIQTISEDPGDEGEAAKEAMESVENPREDDADWAHLWTRWLGLPR